MSSSGIFAVGSVYRIENNKSVTITEVDTTKGIVLVQDEYKQFAGYDLNGDPLSANAKELGRIMSKTSGYEK